MNESQATELAEILGGEAWQSGGGIWLVLFKHKDGKLVVISDEVICEYDNEKKFEESKPAKSILLH